MIRKYIWAIAFLFLPFSVLASTPGAANAELTNNIKQMTAVWNKGDINTFVSFYKNSDSTIYISTTVIHGYQNILQCYLTHYPTRNAMGTLSLSNLEIKTLSPQYAMVIGNWAVVRSPEKNLGGIFTLLYEKTSKGWKIVLDHTS